MAAPIFVPVHVSSEGFDGNPRSVMRFFQSGYSFATLVDLSATHLTRFSGIGPDDQTHLRQQIRVRYRAGFKRLQEGTDRSFPSVRNSLRTLATVSRRREVPLAAAFVIGLRESGGGLLNNRDIEDTFGQSGLDHLHSLQGELIQSGFLPKKLTFDKGSRFGEVNGEIKRCRKFLSTRSGAPKSCLIASAHVPAQHVFLAHSVSAARGFKHFRELATRRGFSHAQIDALSNVSHFFWLSYGFARPGGQRLKKFRAVPRRERSFGLHTLLDYFKERALELDGVRNILVHGKDIFDFPERKLVLRGSIKIAIRTAATIAAIDDMMREYSHERISALELASEFELIRQYLN